MIFIMEKICTLCLIERPIEDFAFKVKSKNRRQPVCRECSKIYKKTHYENNKEEYFLKSKEGKAKLKKWYEDFKKQLKCSECGEDHPAVLDFHHQNDDKEIAICNAIKMGWSIPRIELEIKKCIVLCSNCHRKLHWQVRNSMAHSSSG